MEWFKITHYKGNAIMGQAGNNFSIRNNWVIDSGVYGIFPEFGENGLIENNILSGIEDAAIYVGMSDYIDVRNNQVLTTSRASKSRTAAMCWLKGTSPKTTPVAS
ncbi:MAG: hypothetical protein CM15mP74_16740 [Halieaceae bacterium]|nr:MAG: hypothetical protein CM15mP74_16740 [Halieaceae bacterium]